MKKIIRLKKLINKSGFGLTEVMIASGILLAFGTGLLKLTEISVNSSKVVQTNIEEQALKSTVKELLERRAKCVENFKTAGRLTGTPATTVAKLTDGNQDVVFANPLD